MALKEYLWRGTTWQIADEDIDRFPGAVPVVKASPKAKRKPQNKSRRAPKNK